MAELNSIDPRMDGTLEQRLAWRIRALREALRDVVSMADGAAVQVARNGLLVDDSNAALCNPAQIDGGVSRS